MQELKQNYSFRLKYRRQNESCQLFILAKIRRRHWPLTVVSRHTNTHSKSLFSFFIFRYIPRIFSYRQTLYNIFISFKKWKNSIWLESTILFYRFLFCFPQLSQRDNSPKPINLFQWFARLYDISFFHFILLVAEVFPCTNRHLFVTCLTLWAGVICRKSS